MHSTRIDWRVGAGKTWGLCSNSSSSCQLFRSSKISCCRWIFAAPIRVAIARALANNPPVIIADEPTGNLDSKTAESMFAMFNQLVAQGKTIIIVTHDSGLAKQTHRTALIADGEIVNEYVSKAMPTLTQEQVWQATHSAKRLTFEPGAMILTEGTNADCFYI